MFNWLKFLIVLAIILVGLGFYLTYQVQNDALEAQFVHGKVPTLNGFYRGSASFPVGPWQGKRFDAKSKSGYNVILGRNMLPFKTYETQGIQDKGVKVLAIDYNITHNLFILHPILDEVVEIKSGQYLGKVSIRIIPGVPFSLAYFWLKK